MPFTNMISSTDAAALRMADYAPEIIAEVPQASAVMRLARRLPNMSTSVRNMPVMSALATAYFVTGDTGLKQTSEVNWEQKYITAEELAVIIPIPEVVLDDSKYDLWSEVRPQVIEALGIAIDQAVLYGTNIPTSWTTNLGGAGLAAIISAASHQLSAANYTDLYEAIMGEAADGTDGLLMTVEADGYMVTGHLAHTSFRGKLRNIRDANGALIFQPSMQSKGQYTLDGAPIEFPLNGSTSSTYWDIAGDWSKLVYAIRQDVTFKFLDQAVIQDSAGTIIYNLAQQDMVALRAVMRLGFALPNPINRMNGTAATRLAFASLTA